MELLEEKCIHEIIVQTSKSQVCQVSAAEESCLVLQECREISLSQKVQGKFLQ